MTAPSRPQVRSRWRDGAGDRAPGRPTGARGRVAAVQAQARPTLLLAVAFAVAAAVLALVPADTGRWLPLHLFLAGTLVLAISGASQLFAVTWSAGPAPPGAAVAAQRWAVAAGAAGIVAVRELDGPTWALALAGAVFVTGQVALMALLAGIVRAGVQRRFDVPLAWYVAALVCGVAAAALGLELAGGEGGVRGAHVTLNLLGLVGLVIGGTLPFFAATEARTRMSPRATARRLAALLAWQLAAVATAAAGLATARPTTATVGLGAYGLGLGALTLLLPTVGRKQLRWAGPRLVQLFAGLAWWIGAVASAAVGAAGGGTPFSGDAVVVLVVAGYGQILWASLAYLLPVLRGGGHERLSAGFATTRSWPALAGANLAGGALLAGAGSLAAALTGVWVVDAAVRVVRLQRAA